MLIAGSQIMSGDRAQCTVDMTVISLIHASATVALMPHSTQVTVTADRQKSEDARLKERDGVHALPSVVHGQMIRTGLQATVAQQNGIETGVIVQLIAIAVVVDLQTGIRSVTVKDLDKATMNDGAIGRAHENILGTLTVKAAMDHSRVKTAKIGQ